MRVGIFYLSYSPGADKVRVPLKDGNSVWIRLVEVTGTDLEEALSVAAPRAGESVMNTHELPDPVAASPREARDE